MSEKCGTWPALSTKRRWCWNGIGTVPGLRGEGREGGATAEQGALQQAVRGSRRAGVRKCGGAAGGPATGSGVEHGAGHGPALSGTVGGREAEAGPATDGRG